MPTANAKLTTAVEDYLTDLRRIRASGGATGERSYYPALSALLNTVGATLKPKTFCVAELAAQGAGHPDFGLYTAKQVQKGQPKEGQVPERGVVEVKSAQDDAWLTAASTQVSRYWDRYRLVLVTNTRDFVLVGEDAAGQPATLETFRLADSAETFDRLLETPRAFARDMGAGLGEYLCRALSHRAALTEPKDLAWLLASYARDGLARVETAGDDAPQLTALRTALEEALGRAIHRATREPASSIPPWSRLYSMGYSPPGCCSPVMPDVIRHPEGRRAVHRHRSTGAWRSGICAPVLRALFQQISDPGRLQPLGLVEVLDWTIFCPQPRGPHGLLCPLQRRRSRALFLRTLPRSL